jgi:class 3 adenylate cyclase
MQAGLAERQRLQGVFGTYVDPALAVRLLQQGDDAFTSERHEVSVMFVDIRDFPFTEANTGNTGSNRPVRRLTTTRASRWVSPAPAGWSPRRPC